MADDAHGPAHYRAHRYGVKVWFGSEKPNREHYEAQVLNRRHVDGTEGVVLEVGFHSEHKDPAANHDVLERVTKKKMALKKALGSAAEAGGFYGRPDDWVRVSETWEKFSLEDPDISFEMAGRLIDYIDTIEPLREKA